VLVRVRYFAGKPAAEHKVSGPSPADQIPVYELHISDRMQSVADEEIPARKLKSFFYGCRTIPADRYAYYLNSQVALWKGDCSTL
jgi:hypothetical protein